MADMSQEEDGSWLWWESHCPICSAARACRGFCRSELALFRRLLAPAEVEQGAVSAGGDSRCLYRIRPPAPERAERKHNKAGAGMPALVAFGEGALVPARCFPIRSERLMGLLTR